MDPTIPSQETISLDKLQKVINQLSADLNEDIKTLEKNLDMNKGALMCLTTLIVRINEELTPAEEVGEVEVLPPVGEQEVSSDYSSPI